MASPCPVPGTGTGFLSATLGSLDCQGELLGAAGYQALASTGSGFSFMLTSLLTLFIAIIGIKMLMGHIPSFGDVVSWSIKVGVVLALATSWQAYRILAYDVVLGAPGELAGAIGRSASLPGSNGGLVERLQATDDAIMRLVAVGTGPLDAVPLSANGEPDVRTPQPVKDEFALGLARTAFVSEILATQGLTRLLAGLQLALAPLFAGLLLFEATRDFFWGWVRSLAAVAMAALVSTLVLAVQLAILEPWLIDVLSLREVKISTPSAPFELLSLVLAFGFVMLGGLFLSVKIAFASSVSIWLTQTFQRVVEVVSAYARQSSSNTQMAASVQNDQEPRSRAAVVAEAIATADRRETASAGRAALVARQLFRVETNRQSDSDGVSVGLVPLGQTYSRSARRSSAVADRRSTST